MYVLSQFGLYLLLSLPLIGAYLMFAVGVVVIFRASKVLNLALGAMAVLRTACKVGRDTRFQTFTQVAESLRQALTKLPPLLRLDTSRILAQAKMLALDAFLAALEREAKPALY